jgi:hypothetical protein
VVEASITAAAFGAVSASVAFSTTTTVRHESKSGAESAGGIIGHFAIQPADQRGEKHPQEEHVNHGRKVYLTD